MMRPDICLPVVSSLRDAIAEEVKTYAALPVQAVEWRVDFFAGYEKEIPAVVKELKQMLKDKKLIVTLRTEAEGGEANGSRFDYDALVRTLLEQGVADYVDVEIKRAEPLKDCFAGISHTGVIGSYHDFHKTDRKERIVEILHTARTYNMTVGKYACMPGTKEDVDTLLEATARMKEAYPEFPVITMAMGELGKPSRLYGGLYGSSLSFGCAREASAPGQVYYEEMISVFDKIYKGNHHISLIGFMGAGKSTVSRELKRLSGREEVDTDQWIEKHEKRSISDIFVTEGEAYFRQCETDMLDELGTMEPSIISCGGGMALREINRRKLKAMGEVVLLQASPETILERVKDSTNRPILNGNMNIAFISDLMGKRLPAYEKAATVKISTDGKTVTEIAKEILEKTHQI